MTKQEILKEYFETMAKSGAKALRDRFKNEDGTFNKEAYNKHFKDMAVKRWKRAKNNKNI